MRHGASPAASPADLARVCDVVIILVVDAAEVETVLFGADGAASALLPRSRGRSRRRRSILPIRRMGAADRAFGAALLDAPVSGGPAKAAAGTMTMMVSGDPAALERARRCSICDLGPPLRAGPRAGDASAFKIVNNLLAAANLAAGAEALALAQAWASISRVVAEVIGA